MKCPLMGRGRPRSGTACDSHAGGHATGTKLYPARMQGVAKALTADDVLPLVAALTPRERARLLRLISSPQGNDELVYGSVPPLRDEFSADDEPLAWEAEGWEDAG